MEKKKKQKPHGNVGKKHSEKTKQIIQKCLLGNLNAELYSLEDSLDLFGQMLVMSRDNKYTFIKQLSIQFGISYDIIVHLKKRFSQLVPIYNLIKDNLENNCYTASNEDKLKLPLAILNLKSNYGWTDRIENSTDITTGGEKLQLNNLISFINTDNNQNEE